MFLIGMLFLCLATSAQGNKVPPFSAMQANGKVFKAQDLPLGKPIIIIYFSPDCDHCEKLTQDILKNENDLKNASIAMITFLPVQKVANFVNKYSLSKHPNIYVATEGYSFFLKNYYRITEMPFMALYTKNGDLIKTYTREIPVKNLIVQLKKLQ